MKLKGINSSSKKTKNIIKEYFGELLKEKKEISNITVTELCKRANITRGAFYSHYDNIYAIAEEIESEIQELALSNVKKISSKDDIKYFLNTLFKYIKENESFYKKALQSNDPIMFINRLSKKFFAVFENNLITNNKDFDITIHFCADGAAILLIKYFRGDNKFSLDYIKNYLCETLEKLL
ncbi:MAG: TetR/AcrR family transcriptional regulator [bacterium]|nr:TetR/AcrR family transcriptional regulator [bacterium]